MSKYDDIIDLSRPESHHPHLGVDSRASQFSPFAALTGYDEQVKETARLTNRRIEVDDGLREILNNKLNYINEHIKESPIISITYFVEDKKKDGGEYITHEGIIKRIDIPNNKVIYKDNTKIDMKDILSISGDLFKEIEDMI